MIQWRVTVRDNTKVLGFILVETEDDAIQPSVWAAVERVY